MNSSGLKQSVLIRDTSEGGMRVCVKAGHRVCMVKDEPVESPNCVLSPADDFKLRQLNCGTTGCVVPFA